MLTPHTTPATPKRRGRKNFSEKAHTVMRLDTIRSYFSMFMAHKKLPSEKPRLLTTVQKASPSISGRLGLMALPSQAFSSQGAAKIMAAEGSRTVRLPQLKVRKRVFL